MKLARISLRILPVLALLYLLGGSLVAAQDGTPSPSIPAAQASLVTTLQQSGATISYHAQTGKVRFIGTEVGRPISQPTALSATASREDAARGFLAIYGPLFGLTNQSQELISKSDKVADRGRDFQRFQQVYNGIPVIAGEIIVQLDSRNNILSANGEVLPDISIATSPAIAADSAAQSALEIVAKNYGVQASDLVVSQPELWIYNPELLVPGTGITNLVWRMEVTPAAAGMIRELVLIDAQRGSITLHFNQIDTVLNRKTYTANNVELTNSQLPGTFVCADPNTTCSGGDAHAIAAHGNAGRTYDFYATNFGRNSIDNHGLPLISTVHYGFDYANAGWTGDQMIYGDGDGSSGSHNNDVGYPFGDDVVGHELTHGVTQYESGLFYYYQSGAINESLSDVFGEFVDQTDGYGDDSAGVKWLLGEDVTNMGAIRNMANPPAFGDPDKITSANYYIGSGDNGGVHFNSGVNNKAAFLMTDGGTFNSQTVAALGIPKVAQIYYEVQTHLLTSGADYGDLADALYQGCLNVIGKAGITGANCLEVRKATLAVEMNLEPYAGYNPEAELCPTGYVVGTTAFSDDMESGPGKWLVGALVGSNRWFYGSPYGAYAHSGSNFLYADDYPPISDTSFAMMKNSVVLPANAYLHFAHAFGFEDPDYDGGVVEYSVNNGASWTDAGTLFDVNGYNGTITPINYDNPLQGRNAFVNDSHGYISSRANLSALAGQSIRFRWRIGLDYSPPYGYDWGWWLDDVQIYSCTNVSAANVAPTTNTFTSGSTPTLTWNLVTYAIRYEVQIAKDPAFKVQAIADQTVNAPSLFVTIPAPLNDGTYYWRVRGCSATTCGGYSTTQSFKIGS